MGNFAGVVRGAVWLWCGACAVEALAHNAASCINTGGNDYYAACTGEDHFALFHFAEGGQNGEEASASCGGGFGRRAPEGKHFRYESSTSICSGGFATFGEVEVFSPDPECAPALGAVILSSAPFYNLAVNNCASQNSRVESGEYAETEILAGFHMSTADGGCLVGAPSTTAGSCTGEGVVTQFGDDLAGYMCVGRGSVECGELAGWSGSAFGCGYLDSCSGGGDGGVNGGGTGSIDEPVEVHVGDQGFEVTIGGQPISVVLEGATAAEVANLAAQLTELERIEALAEGFNRGSITEVIDFAGAVSGSISELLTNVRAFSCLGGLTGGLFGDARQWVSGRREVAGVGVDWLGAVGIRKGHAFFGGGFSTAAMIPILLDILGTDLRELAISLEQLCHDIAQEAHLAGQTILQGDILRAVAPPGGALWNAGEHFEPEGVDGMDSLLDEYNAHLTANPISERGTTTESLGRLIRAEVEGTKALLAALERGWGVQTKESGANEQGVIGPIDGYTEVVGADGEVRNVVGDAELAEYYPFNEGSESGAKAKLMEYVGDFDLDGLRHQRLDDLSIPGASGVCIGGEGSGPSACVASGGVWTVTGTLPGECLEGYSDPVGEAREGIAGAFRRLRWYAVGQLRGSSAGGFLCNLIPPGLTAEPTEVCFGDADNPIMQGGDFGTSYGGESYSIELPQTDAICVYGPDAPEYAPAVWTALQVLVHIGAGWVVYGIWFGRTQ